MSDQEAVGGDDATPVSLSPDGSWAGAAASAEGAVEQGLPVLDGGDPVTSGPDDLLGEAIITPQLPEVDLSPGNPVDMVDRAEAALLAEAAHDAHNLQESTLNLAEDVLANGISTPASVLGLPPDETHQLAQDVVNDPVGTADGAAERMVDYAKESLSPVAEAIDEMGASSTLSNIAEEFGL